ncbi:MAG: type II toxin-antitoxin system HicB family antitoxin [Pyrinomonadaceae bacterium]
MKQEQTFTASIRQEDEWFVAQCIEVNVASQGTTEDEAIDNLRDALGLHFTPPIAADSQQIPAPEIHLFIQSA